MKFREFYESDDLSFWVGSVQVTVKEVPLARHERIMFEGADQDLINVIKSSLELFVKKAMPIIRNRPVPERGSPVPDIIPPDTTTSKEVLKKFKVTLRYPRTKKGLRLGHYMPDVLYVFAKNANEAKQKAEMHVRTQWEPIENDETRRFRKDNFLRDIQRKHMDIKTSKVKSWDDFVQMLGDIGKKRGAYLLDYFDENDLQMILKRARRGDFEQDLAALDPTQQKMLKKVYFMLAQDPDLSEKTRSLLDDAERSIRKVGRQIKPYIKPERETGEDTPSSEWPYWSIHEPKSEEEEREVLSGLYTPKDVFNAAAKFGIPPKDLRDMASHEIEVDRRTYKEEMRLYNDVWKMLEKDIEKKRSNWMDRRIRTPNRKIILGKHEGAKAALRKVWSDGLDYDSEIVHQLGIEWSDVVRRLMPMSGHHGEYDAFPFHDSGSPDETKNVSEASDWLWNFIQNRPMAKPLVKYYRDALDKLMLMRSDSKRTSEPGGSDDVPF